MLSSIKPTGNQALKKKLIKVINDNKLTELKQLLSELLEDNLLPDEKNELIRYAQRKNFHAIIIFLKNHFQYTIHLGIHPAPFGENKPVLIGQEPLNTTGDFYYVLAYIALSKSLGYDIPKLVFTYEKTKDSMTELSYLRDVAFLEMLGLEHLLKEDIDAAIEKLGRSSSNTRRLALREKIAQGNYHLLDQKATTLILADQYILFGHEQISARKEE